DTEISAQIGNTRSHKFHYLILHIAVCEHCSDNRERHILRSYARHRLSCHIHADYSRHIDIVRLGEKLLHQLRSALAHCHGSQRTVAGMAVRAKDHLSAARKHFTRELMNDCLMRRYVYAAVLLSAGQSK